MYLAYISDRLWAQVLNKLYQKIDIKANLLLSQSLDDLGTTRGECLGRTQWSSPLDLTTYLYYFTSGCGPITTQSHVLSRTFYDHMTLSHDMIT